MIGRIYRTAQYLSIDIVIGVVILLRFFCAYFQVQVGWQVYALLGVSVWLIYTVDHLFDAKKASNSKRGRYQFHIRHCQTLQWISVFLIVLAMPLLFFIPEDLLIGGVVISSISLLYLFIQQKLSHVLFKEFYVAVVYVLGILMVPFLVGDVFRLDVLVVFLLLTFSNLLIFSWYEKEEDIKDGFSSIATRISKPLLEKIILGSLTLGFTLAMINLTLINVYFLISFIIYSLMIVDPKWFKTHDRYRVVGDAVFLIPILFEWI